VAELFTAFKNDINFKLKTKIMKKRIFKSFQFIGLILLLSITFSCANDDEVPPSIIGRWAFDKVVPFINGEAQLEQNSPFNDPNGTKSFLEFKIDNTMLFGRYSGPNLSIVESYFTSDDKFISFVNPTAPNTIAKILLLTKTDLEIQVIDRFSPINEKRAIIEISKFKRVQ
jgi:hypothetical protein